MLNNLLHRVKLIIAKRDLELALCTESSLREMAKEYAGKAELLRAEASQYRREVLPARERHLHECEINVLAGKIGRM